MDGHINKTKYILKMIRKLHNSGDFPKDILDFKKKPIESELLVSKN